MGTPRERLAQIDRAIASVVASTLGRVPTDDDVTGHAESHTSSITAMGDAALLDLVQAVSATARRLDGLLIEAAGEVAARCSSNERAARLSTRMGCANTAELLQRTTLVSRRRAVDLARVADEVRPDTSLTTGELLPPRYPALREALVDGAVGVDGLLAATSPLRDASARLGADELAAADAELAAAARGGGVDQRPPADAEQLRLLAQALALYFDPDGAEPREQRALAKRELSMGPARDGLIPIRGRLLPEVAAQLQRITDCILNPRVPVFEPTRDADATTRDADAAACNDAAGDDADLRGANHSDASAGDVTGGHDHAESAQSPASAADTTDTAASSSGLEQPQGPVDTRTPAQKRHDALASALTVAAGSGGLPSLGGDAPTLVIVARRDDLHGGAGTGTGAGAGQAQVHEHDEPVSLAAARQAACAGRVTRVDTDRHGRVVALTTEGRIFDRRQRAAIAARDGGCLIPGCTVPANWCEVHHVQEWADGGPTSVDNGVLLCWAHHRTLDQSDWGIRMIGGVPEVRAPRWWDPSARWRRPTRSLPRLLDRLEDTYGAAAPQRGPNGRVAPAFGGPGERPAEQAGEQTGEPQGGVRPSEQPGQHLAERSDRETDTGPDTRPHARSSAHVAERQSMRPESQQDERPSDRRANHRASQETESSIPDWAWKAAPRRVPTSNPRTNARSNPPHGTPSPDRARAPPQ